MIIQNEVLGVEVDLRFPYDRDFLKGVLYDDDLTYFKNKHLLLIRTDGTSTATTYARYIMSINLGRYLSPIEKVSIINDKKPITISNLKIVSYNKVKIHDIYKPFYKSANIYINPKTGKKFVELTSKDGTYKKYISYKKYFDLV